MGVFMFALGEYIFVVGDYMFAQGEQRKCTWKNKFISFEQEVYQISCTRLREDDSETAALTILGSCRDTASMQGNDLFTEAETDA